MKTPLLVCLIAALIVALLAPAAMAIDIKIDDTVHASWIAVSGTWTLGTSSSSRYGNSYYYCNQNPSGDSAVTFTPDIPIDGANWEVYVWYSAGLDRAVDTECIVHHSGVDATIPVNQQQNGGMWVYLGTYEMSSGTSNYVRITNRGPDTNKIVVADAVRLYAVGGDLTPPIISNVAAQPGATSVVITWDTDEPATSQVEYGKTTNLGHFSDLDNTLVQHHEISITGLETEQFYHFKVRSEDGAGNLSVSADGQFVTKIPDTYPPLISNIVVIPGANSAVVKWDTDEPATSQVDYGITTDLGSSTALDTRLVTSHHVSLTGLVNSNLYYFRVRSRDGSGNSALSDTGTFTTTAADATPPVISNVTAEPDPNSAMIAWDTNEYATSQVEYGLTESYGSFSEEDSRLLLKHSMGLANLEPKKLYHYRVISKDGSGNKATSADYTFTTPDTDSTGPEISEVMATPGSHSCVITWITDEPSTTGCRYGLTDAADQTAPTNTDLVTEHSITLTGLTAATKYYFFAVSSDAQFNSSDMGAFEFTTKLPDETAPEITEITTDPGSNSVIITWVTDEPATSQVDFGATPAYGTSTPCDENLVTNHRVVITGLTPSTEYHFSVRSADGDGNEAVSPDGTFTTAGPDVTPPVISEVRVSRSVNSAIVRWRTNEPATSQIEYGTTAEYGSQTAPDADLVTVHSVPLSGLEASTLYHFRVKSTDGAGNEAISGDYTFETSASAPEYRMIWADTWHNGFLSAEETTQFVDTVAAANYNAIVVEVRKAGDAYYMSGYEPWATNINPPSGAYDPLQDLINKAHAADIEVHAWIVTYRAWYKTWPTPPEGHVYRVHGPETGLYQDWTMRNSTGGYMEGNSLNIDPGVPGVQDYLVNIVKDIVTKYPQVDGVNFDYVRYPGTSWGYNEITKQRFYGEHGYMPPTSSSDPNWGTWCDYRRQQVTDLVRKCYVEAMAINPRIKMSVDTVGWEGADPNTNYPATAQYASVFQDARGWMNDHIVDINILMNYKREFDAVQKPSYRRWADWLPRVANTSGRLAVDGQGVYLNSISGSITQMLYSRNAGANGMCSYSYAVTNKDGSPAADFFTTVRLNVHDTPAPVPDMPWKDAPTTGIIFGTVTDASHPGDPIYGDWIYQAYATLSGTVNREAMTDATGTYAFVDLPPGNYTLTISKPGYRIKAFGGITIEPGQVLRQDAELVSGMFTSPPGTVTAGWNLVSVPLQPADANPQVVFSGINIDGNLYRWDRLNQGLVCYSQISPGVFGSVSVDEGYWLQTTRSGVISYEPADVEPPSVRTLSLPKAGWSIIGCPFTSPRDWNLVEVSHGDRTIPIATARDWGWLYSICYWWDNSVAGGGLCTMGLDDEWTETSVLQPWKGYWIETRLDSIGLTIN